MYNKRIVLDFDDTLSFTTNRSWDEALPNIDLINKINKLYDEGWEINIYTARGSLSCKTRSDAEKKYKEQIEEWLFNNNVKYNKLSFDKPLAAYYVDDKGITPDDFLNVDIRQLEGGLANTDIYTDGLIVNKTAENSKEVIQWFNKANEYGFNVPKIHRLVGDTITMDYIHHNINYFENNLYRACGIIIETLDKMKAYNSLTTYVWDDYVNRINNHFLLAPTDVQFIFYNSIQYAKEIDFKLNCFAHGDFGIKNLLFTENHQMYMIDPLVATYTHPLLDAVKFCASLYYNNINIDIINKTISILSSYFNESREGFINLLKLELIRVYKYYPNKEEFMNIFVSI